MLFKNRQHVGTLLAAVLNKYKNVSNTVVIGLPRGGVVVAYEVAHTLNLPLDIICARKISAPNNPEFGIGAITETGESFIDQDLVERLDIPESYLVSEILKEKNEANRRLNTYRNNRPPLDLDGKTVILIDDGIATGVTMKAAIKSVKAKKGSKIIVAVPITSLNTMEEIKQEVDEVIYLAAPIFFQSVGQFYKDFSQTRDEEVVQLLNSIA